MPIEWVLEVKQQGASVAEDCLSLAVKHSQSGQQFDVITACGSIEKFTDAVQELKGRLDQMVEGATRQWSELKGAGVEGKVSPQEAWQKMAGLESEQAMFQYFNGLSASTRQAVAEYVFSQVNMFKGRGPVFSQHYDSETHLLE